MDDLSPTSEVSAIPSPEWRWNHSVEEYVTWNQREVELCNTTARHRRLDLRRWRTMCLRVGVNPPESPAGVTEEQVRAIRTSGIWRSSTLKPIFCGVRGLLRWGGNDLATRVALWRLPSGVEDRRNWITEAQLAALFEASDARVRVRVALQGYNGLREGDVRSLVPQQLSLALPSPTMRILGKGRFGGKWRTIPVFPTPRAVLSDWIQRVGPGERVYPVSHSVAHDELAAAGRRAGIPVPVSGHVLRRSFGRIAMHAGIPIPRIQQIMGHSSIDQTLHYIGVELDALSADGPVFEQHMQKFATSVED